MNLCIGVDPSMNSSGLAFLLLDSTHNIISEEFNIITPGNKKGVLTKNEAAAEAKYDYFNYFLYERLDPATAEDNHIFEEYKTINMMSVVNSFKTLVDKYINEHSSVEHIYLLMEGISYGSSQRTKSVFDLAGLNYLIRNAFINHDKLKLIIATPSEIKKFTTGNGNCKKEQMIGLFQITHPNFELPKIDDVADAYWMATYAKNIMIKNI